MSARVDALIVVGLSACGLVRAAGALRKGGLHERGLRIGAIDGFGDVDTRAGSDVFVRMDLLSGHGPMRMTTAALLAAIGKLLSQRAFADLDHARIAVMIASGLEHMPDAFRALRHRWPRLLLAFNDDAVRGRCLDPSAFFDAVRACALAHPEFRLDRPTGSGPWLSKRPDSCGGAGVHWLRSTGAISSAAISSAAIEPGNGGRPNRHRYWQRWVAGESWSVGFCRGPMGTRIAGFQKQMKGAPGARFAYRGSMGPLGLSDPARRLMEAAVPELAKRLDVRGLCTLDFVLDAQGLPNVLELNTRPGASLALYPDAGAQLRVHLDAFSMSVADGAPEPAGTEASGPGSIAPGLNAFRIVYAPRRLFWPDRDCETLTVAPFSSTPLSLPFVVRLSDRPEPHARIDAGLPVCTVHVSAADESVLRQRLDAAEQAVVRRLCRASAAAPRSGDVGGLHGRTHAIATVPST